MVTESSCLKVPELKNLEKLISHDFTRVGMQIDVFWTCPNLLGIVCPFQLFRTKNHLTTSHKIPINWVEFVYSEKAKKFCKISTLLVSTVHTDKSKVEISQNFVAFSEYMNFKKKRLKSETCVSANYEKLFSCCFWPINDQ